MQRRAYAPGLAALLAAVTAGVTGLTGCTAGSGGDGSPTDSKAGSPAEAAAPPGKYRTLLEPCGSVQRSTLRDLLPGIDYLPEEQREHVYRGTAAVTYDTDRRAGCSWKADGPDASHQLTLDFERVVSYDPAVSDDDRAQQVYTGKESAAGLSAGPTAPLPSGSPADPPAGASPAGAAAAGTTPQTAGPGTPTSTGTTTSAPEGLEPRLLAGLGDAAFLDDVLTRAGSTAQRRTVSVVFRTSNVIVTVRYGEQPGRITEVPDSKELQEKAQGLARTLAEKFDE
ncbi:hypothetical protein [Streptomyces sp. NRRL S-118]|uniref:hypothetical protein n=1 Tax=Streptomyces sp. NRRL S-118 TaxID=1463881 RepID=UPI0004C8343B|nr:hypothetical protein [Streptomyces sp. NRRL S-118]